MMTRCPTQPELLLNAMRRPDDSASGAINEHLDQCESCQTIVAGLREVAAVLQSSRGDSIATGDCLDEMTVAKVVEQGVDAVESPAVIPHLTTCARCREQVASVARLLGDPSVATEIGRIKVATPPPARRPWRLVGGGALVAAAAAATFMVGGSRNRVTVVEPLTAVVGAQTHREPGMTTTVAPSVIAPIGAIGAADTFRWTSVPRADRYRLRVFDRGGTAVWEVEVNDTAVVRPDSIAGDRGSTYLWKVEARTGWDRWVASDLVEFSVALPGRIP